MCWDQREGVDIFIFYFVLFLGVNHPFREFSVKFWKYIIKETLEEGSLSILGIYLKRILPD